MGAAAVHVLLVCWWNARRSHMVMPEAFQWGPLLVKGVILSTCCVSEPVDVDVIPELAVGRGCNSAGESYCHQEWHCLLGLLL